MAVLTIRRFPDPVLKEKVLPVEKIDGEILELIKNMADTMYAAPGIGLAANQVGILKRVIVVDVDDKLMAFINPEIVWYSDEVEEGEEGCLSVDPDIHVMVPRSTKIKLRAKNEKGEDIELEAEGLLARALQHEVDHINGIIILDRTSPEERKKALRELANKIRRI
ncbi:MAG: peptide deformylase [Actinomycetota bacterium]